MSVHGINEPALRQRLESKCIGQDAVDKVTEEFKVHDKLTKDDHEELARMVQEAHLKHSNHDDMGAAEMYNKVLEVDPLDFECLNNLGKISYSGGDLQRARELFEKAVVLKPEREKTMYHLAVVLYEQHETDRARILLEQVVQGYNGPKSGIIGESADTNTFHNSIAMLGLIHQSILNDTDRAEKLYQVVLKQNGDHVLTLDHMCALHAITGRADEAAKLHRRVCNLDPNHTRKSCPYLDSLFPAEQALMHKVQTIDQRLEEQSTNFAVGSRAKHWTHHPWRSLIKKLRRLFGGGKGTHADAGGASKKKPVAVV
jgi:tetratricopeptide (TPR) repeat protein